MREGKRITAVLLTMAMVIGSFATNPYMAEAKSKKAVKSVSISNVDSKTLVLKKGQKYKLKAKVKVTGGASKKVTWKSSKSKIVSVSSKGVLKAKKKGTAKITVKSKANSKKKATLTVKVGTPVKKINLAQKQLKVTVGKTVKIKATVSPGKPTVKKLSYSVNNKKIATVNKSGVVKGVAKGTAKVTVKATDSSKKKAVATIEVVEEQGKTTVQPKPTTPNQPNQPKPTQPTNPDDTDKIVYTEADLKWEDDFKGKELDTSVWNVEEHEPGWVNKELQKYVNSDKNIYLEDGNLVIKAIKAKDDEGKVSYTSGRINTQGNKDYKYGKFEAKIKVPKGKGFLPAFWMMPTDENLYGQWPKCGEIDIMEVMGQENDKLYGTIHYGEPSLQSQGTYKLSEGNFTDDWHVFSCEWEPGKISWYVDGILYHEESDWFSAKPGQGKVSYPAPFDQDFYIILNLAVGGSWVTNPDETTSFDDAKMLVDYVKVYQKDESAYDENVKKPVKEVDLRDPAPDGNYVNNGNFAEKEDLADDTNWKFMTAEGGEATAEIENNAITVKTTNAGTVDYSVQLVQAGIPFEKGATYQVSFDAKASEPRTMKVDVKAPDYGYASYMPSKTVELTTDKKSYTLDEFKMTGDSDANGRLEFNMGAADSTADIEISNVRIEQKKDADPNEKEVKTVLADGNHVYNGSFQEGEDRLGYWEIVNKIGADISVTNKKNDRYLQVKVDADKSSDEAVQIKQSDLALLGEKNYELSFKAWADAEKTMKVMVAGKEYDAKLSQKQDTYTFKFTTEKELADKNIIFYMGEQGTICLDDVRLVEDSLIKNGSFDAEFSGYEVYVYDTASASYVVDSQKESNAADFTIKRTGKEPYMVQLKQSNVSLEKDKWYTLQFDVKSNMARTIQYSIQRDGNKHKVGESADWTPYVQEDIALAGNDTEYQHICKTFQMKEETDSESIFNIAMGGGEITQQHRICIDNISLEETEAPKEEESENMLNQDNWKPYVHEESGAQADYSNIPEGAFTFDIKNVGTDDWNVQLKNQGIQLVKNCKYRASFTIKSTEARTVKFAMLGQTEGKNTPYFAGADIELKKDQELDFEKEFTMTEDTYENAIFQISMGKMGQNETPLSTIIISNLKLVKIEENTTEGEELIKNGNFANNGDGWYGGCISPSEGNVSYKENKAIFTITNPGTKEWNVQLKQENITLETGGMYQVSFKVKSNVARQIKWILQHNGEPYTDYAGQDMNLDADDEVEVNYPFTVSETTDEAVCFQISMGKIDDNTPEESTITISDVSLIKLPAE